MTKIKKCLIAIIFMFAAISGLAVANPVHVHAEEPELQPDPNHVHNWSYYPDGPALGGDYHSGYHWKICSSASHTEEEGYHYKVKEKHKPFDASYPWCDCGVYVSNEYCKPFEISYTDGYTPKDGDTIGDLLNHLSISNDDILLERLEMINKVDDAFGGSYDTLDHSKPLTKQMMIRGTIIIADDTVYNVFAYDSAAGAYLDEVTFPNGSAEGKIYILNGNRLGFSYILGSEFQGDGSGDNPGGGGGYTPGDLPGNNPGVNPTPNPENGGICWTHWLSLVFIVIYCVLQVGIYLFISRSSKDDKEEKENKKSLNFSLANILHLATSLVFLIIGILLTRCGFCVALLIIECILIAAVSCLASLSILNIGKNKASKTTKKDEEANNTQADNDFQSE